MELVPDILNEIVFELVLGLKADDFRGRAGAGRIILEEFQLGGFRFFLPDEASGELLDLPGVAVDPPELAGAPGLDPDRLPGTLLAVEVLVGIQGDHQVASRPEQGQQDLQHVVPEILALVHQEGVTGAGLRVVVFQGLPGQLEDGFVISRVRVVEFHLHPQDLLAYFVKVGDLDPVPSHADPLFLEEPLQVAGQGDVVADQKDPFHPGAVFS